MGRDESSRGTKQGKKDEKEGIKKIKGIKGNEIEGSDRAEKRETELDIN